MIFRTLTERITLDNYLGHYFFNWCGDEILLKATSDADALVEGAALQIELEAEESQ